MIYIKKLKQFLFIILALIFMGYLLFVIFTVQKKIQDIPTAPNESVKSTIPLIIHGKPTLRKSPYKSKQHNLN